MPIFYIYVTSKQKKVHVKTISFPEDCLFMLLLFFWSRKKQQQHLTA